MYVSHTNGVLHDPQFRRLEYNSSKTVVISSHDALYYTNHDRPGPTRPHNLLLSPDFFKDLAAHTCKAPLHEGIHVPCHCNATLRAFSRDARSARSTPVAPHGRAQAARHIQGAKANELVLLGARGSWCIHAAVALSMPPCQPSRRNENAQESTPAGSAKPASSSRSSPSCRLRTHRATRATTSPPS